MQNVCIVAGARPNFIKVAPIMRAIDNAAREGRSISYRLVYAGTPADTTLEPSLFDDLQIKRPDVFLGVDCTSLNELTGRVMAEFERYLSNNPTDTVIVVDDLASTMAVAIVTKKRGLRLAHLVAGTRSFDINMPKEINRLVIDALSDMLFTAGDCANSIAARGGADVSNIYMVGNILMDTLRLNHDRMRRPAVADSLGLTEGGYIVLTLNRHALLSDTANLRHMLSSLAAAAHGVPVVAPLRGRASRVVGALAGDRDGIHLTAPLPYLEFGWLAAHAKGIVTDSGNVAEEATFNSVPCITLNSYTEHIETVKQGTNLLVGEDAVRLAAAVTDMVGGRWKKSALPDRWDGRTAERIVRIICGA